MDPLTLTQATKVLEIAKKAEIPVIAVEGNHDSTYFKDSFSWMDYLAKNDLIINLKPSFEDRLELNEWDGGSGAYIDLEGARIYGMKYYGSLTGKIMEDYRKKIKKKGFTVFTAHAGVEGYLNIYGCIPSSIIHNFRDKVDYVALGHIHKSYVEGDFVFNPGSLEICDITEKDFDKGVFYVQYGEGLKYELIGGFSRRMFLSLSYKIKDERFLNHLDKDLKAKNIENSVVHIHIQSKKQFGIKAEDVERVVNEFKPLIVRLKYETEDFYRPTVPGKESLEKEVIEQLLKSFNYENFADEVLRLKNIFSSSFNLNSVDEFIESILKGGSTAEMKLDGEVSEVQKQDTGKDDTVDEEESNHVLTDDFKGQADEDEWDWRKAIGHDTRS
jgi:DNA repair exonuclease SbcCD nuclease subunit